MNSSLCEKCGRFMKPNLMQSHQEQNCEPFICELCSKGFNKNSNLKRHVDTVHHNSNSRLCVFCGKEFNDVSNFRRHQTNCKFVKPHLL